ncbi:hypothetical protein Tco_0752007 [Tanacetum coccineum]|uniref:KIB1-4 beta-propeller domain-containing protein n=1 Tax=Tanacetum coccineum TaxID=301880 RepID=A0ABQ4Z7A2_9ASTR
MTSKVINLPTLTLKDGDYESIGECCLSAPPVDPSSIFLLTRTNKSTFLFCWVNGERKMLSWTEMSYAKQLKKLTNDGDLVHSLTCCNGKVYALSTDGPFGSFIINVDIVVTDKKVEIKLMMFGVLPLPSSSHYAVNTIEYLKGSSTDLFYVEISFQKDTKNVPSNVNIFKSDMTCVNWEERECLKHWDLTDFTGDGVQWDDLGDWHLSCKTWEEMDDIKNKIFFVDLARDHLVSSSCVIASELGVYTSVVNRVIRYTHTMSRVILSPCFLYLLQCCQQAMCQSGNAGIALN